MLAEPEFPAMALLVGQPAFRRAVLMKNDGLPFAESFSSFPSMFLRLYEERS
jgi:hypothetical protein